MTFALKNSIYMCQGRQESSSFNSNLVTSMIDFALVASSATIGGLLLSGVFNFGLPTGVGTIGHYLACSCIGLGGSIAIADVVTAIVTKKNKANTTPTQMQNCHMISTIQASTCSEENRSDSQSGACHKILNGLYLGNSEAFAQTTDFACNRIDATTCAPIPIDVSNPLQFCTIITVCSLQAVSADYSELTEKDIQAFETSFKNRNISWHYVGRMALDDPSRWLSLVHDCTFVNTSLGQMDIPAASEKQQEQVEAICQQKSDEISKTAVQDWFKPIFTAIDEGVINHKKVLVHCQAGQSRSAAVLAAYFINRQGLSATEAINFLKMKRLCVDPKFVSELQAYEISLKQTG